MKKIVSLVLVMWLLLLLGCTKNTWIQSDSPIIPKISHTTSGNIPENTIEEQVSERQTYENKTDGFSLQFPSTWTFQEQAYGASVVFSSPTSETDKIKENVAITRTPLNKTYTVEEYYIINKERLATQNGYNEIENSIIKINNLDAKKIIFTSTFEDKKLQFEEIFIIDNNFLYTITYTATQDTFDKYIKKVDKMVASIKIK